MNVSGLDALESCLLPRRGELAEAERLARCGVEVAETTDFYEVRGFAFECLAETLALAGKQDEAVSSLERATEVYEEKGDVVFAARAREKLGSL